MNLLDNDIILSWIDLLESKRAVLQSIQNEIINLGEWCIESDIRANIFNRIDQILISHNTCILLGLLQVNNSNVQFEYFKVPTLKDAHMISHAYFVFVKNSLIYNLSSVIERQFRIVYEVLEGKSSHLQAYYKVRKVVFEKLNLNESSNAWSALSLFSLIRNTTHNNGRHGGEKRTVVYRKQEFVFNHDVPHNYATYDLIHLIIQDFIAVMKEISFNAKIYSLKPITEK